MNVDNNKIFEENLKEYVDHSINGGCSTIIAYGQT